MESPKFAGNSADFWCLGSALRDVDGGVAGPRRGNQLEMRQLLQVLPCEPSAFAHDVDHVEGAKPLNHCHGIGDVVVEPLISARRRTADQSASFSATFW